MEVILAGIAILLSLVSLIFLVIEKMKRQSAGKHLSSRMSELRKNLQELQKQVNNLPDQLGQATPSPAQADGISNEISTLKAELEYIKRDLRANSQILSNHSREISEIKEKNSGSEAEKATPAETFRQELSPFSELDRSAQGTTPFPSLGSVPWLGVEQPNQDQPAEDFSPIEEPVAQPSEPYEQAARQYQDAIDRGDRQALRQLLFKELNITSECEDSLLRGSSGQATKLEAVQGGGSYMVVSGEGRYWLFPTAQTLDSFSMNQPQKGIFDYEREILSKPVVKKPAEVKEESGDWIVIAKGMISVPG
ncbi:hypothetical protein [Synechococcus sp. CBW1107]|uniref:hypothetical protein n=1 Tax=Synechococcus sp. CBW1107 TaxID=2789857 RepID=UPI002AD43894|nr:hypothetical protein [Synechococcus sp. CBW1107]CAK6689823.1 hypothetical protein MNNICLKF_00697 [Synechococcus sp. CBW1107]